MEVLWKKCLEEIEKQVLPENFNTWFSPTHPVISRNGNLTIAVPNEFFKRCLEENYLELIESTLELIADKRLQVDFQIVDRQHEESAARPPAKAETGIMPPSAWSGQRFASNLNPKYTFSNFIVGSSNQFAHAAGLAVASHPGQTYNPLFIYGAVGLGKTHLLHAIGGTILEKNPAASVRYISAESFTVDLIQSLKRDDMQAFRRRYRPLDVLLVDDVQFIAGKERTQEEFFYTFNALYESHKQVVLSSDKFPKDMQKIEERLRSRFESGLIADIKPPDLETKIAILYKKADLHQKEIPDEVAVFIASNIKSNIRELEGLLLRIIAFSSFTQRKIDLVLAKEVLKEFTFDKNRNFTLPVISKTVAAFFNLKMTDLKSKSRKRVISLPRQVAMFICREYTQASLPEIGKHFGGKDHTTVLFAHRKITNSIKENNEITQSVQQIIKTIECG